MHNNSGDASNTMCEGVSGDDCVIRCNVDAEMQEVQQALTCVACCCTNDQLEGCADVTYEGLPRT